MFVQVIQGSVVDKELLTRQNERWLRELKPGATGYLGATGGITPDGRAITLARFETAAAARANSERAEQGAWWNETEKAFGDDVEFHDCHDVDTMFGGGSNDAGFVQIIQGRAKDQRAMRATMKDAEERLREARPDILGVLVAWHGDRGFTQAVYFESEAAARSNEGNSGNEDMDREFMDLFDGPPAFFDLPQPELD